MTRPLYESLWLVVGSNRPPRRCPGYRLPAGDLTSPAGKRRRGSFRAAFRAARALEHAADGGGDVAEDAIHVLAQELQGADREHCHQAKDERVLDERLALLVPLPQPMKQIDEHSKSHLLPSTGYR